MSNVLPAVDPMQDEERTVPRVLLLIVAWLLALQALAADDDTVTPPTLYTARRIITMEPALPVAGAVAVAGGRIVAVGSRESLAPWQRATGAVLDARFADAVIMPGFIDPHVHPALPALLTQFPFIAPDDWSLPTGEFPAARTPEAFRARLREWVARHTDASVPFIAWGYHPLWHGEIGRAELNALFPATPVMLWHRSFHELIGNDAAFRLLGVEADAVRGLPQVDWEHGRFYENGLAALLPRMGFLFRPERFGRGMRNFLEMLHRGGVTTALDMGVGVTGDPATEIAAIRAAAEGSRAPARIVLTPIITSFLQRKVAIPQALAEIDRWRQGNSRRVQIDRRFKLMLDGAIWSGLAQFGPPGYLDGHPGVWMVPEDTTTAWAQAFWDAGYQLHAHTNGDASAARLIALLRTLQAHTPRSDHRLVLEHFAYTTEDQNRQLRALGMVVSANPWYVHMLSEAYGAGVLGPDRASQMVRLGSLERLGVPFALHSDSPMAPLQPLALAWAAANRITIGGGVAAPAERVSLDAAMRAITIDAAWIMRREDEIGSIRAGKRADFTVLDKDPWQVGARRLRDIRVLATVFEGEVAPLADAPAALHAPRR